MRFVAFGTATVLGLLLSACGGGDGEAPTPAAVVLVSGGSQQGTVGQALAAPIVLTIRDAQGAPVPRAAVSVAPQSNSGTVSGASLVANESGQVQINGWTLGTVAGPQSLLVTSASARLTVTAIAAAGAPTAIQALSANPASGSTGKDAGAFGVKLVDAYGNAAAGRAVSFTAAADSGAVPAATVQTDADGVAKLAGWTLGAKVGQQTLAAKVDGLPALALTVNAALTGGCATNPAAVGLSFPGSWTANDCADTTRDRLYDEYTLKLDAQTNFKAQVSGMLGREFRIFAADGRSVGAQPSDGFAPAGVDPLELQYALPAGEYKLRTYTDAANTLGNYTLKLSSDFSTQVTEPTFCRPVIFTTYGASFVQALSTSSCFFRGGYEDRYIVLMQQGETINIDLESSVITPGLFFRDDRTPTSPILVRQVLAAPGKASVSWTATFTGFHEIIVISASGTLGEYRLTVK